MIRQSAKYSASISDFESQIAARIQGLSQSNALLLDRDWQRVPLEKLIISQLAPFIGTDEARIEMSGPSVFVESGCVQTLGLALHELATNASKYGALSVPEGKIVLHWKFTGGDVVPECFRLEWREHGGLPVKPATRTGFGSFVIDRMVNSALNAKVEIELAPEGLRWTLNMPASQVGRAQENVPL